MGKKHLSVKFKDIVEKLSELGGLTDESRNPLSWIHA